MVLVRLLGQPKGLFDLQKLLFRPHGRRASGTVTSRFPSRRAAAQAQGPAAAGPLVTADRGSRSGRGAATSERSSPANGRSARALSFKLGASTAPSLARSSGMGGRGCGCVCSSPRAGGGAGAPPLAGSARGALRCGFPVARSLSSSCVPPEVR